MRALVLCVVASSLGVSCVEQVEPPRASAPAMTARERMIYSSDSTGSANAAPSPSVPDAERVRAALFPKSLREMSACRRRTDEPNTWVAVDERQSENYATGEYVPHVLHRFEGSFTEPAASEVLFVIRIENCQSNTFGHRVFVVFPRVAFEGAPGRLPAPSLRFEDNPDGSAMIVAMFGAEGEAPRFVEVTPNDVRVVELNRSFTRDASFGLSDNATRLDGTPVGVYWRVLQTFHELPAGRCRTLFVTSASPRTVREEVRSCSAAAPRKRD